MNTIRNKISPLKQQTTKSLILVYVLLIALLVVAELLSPGFLKWNHMENLLRQSAFLGIVSIGVTFVILIGGLDMSTGFVVSFANILAAQIMDGKDANIFTAFIVILAVGTVIGLVNGLGIYFLKIPPLVMTIAMGSVVQGMLYIYSGGAPKGFSAPAIQALNSSGDSFISGILIIWIIAAAITIFILKYTVFGKNIYALGISSTAAKYSGVDIAKTTISSYVICAITASVTGFLLVGYTGTSFLTAGSDYTLNSIAAVIIGGTSVAGGRGGYVGSIAGTLLMTVIVSILTIAQIPASGKLIVQGLIIISLVLIYGRQEKIGS